MPAAAGGPPWYLSRPRLAPGPRQPPGEAAATAAREVCTSCPAAAACSGQTPPISTRSSTRAGPVEQRDAATMRTRQGPSLYTYIHKYRSSVPQSCLCTAGFELSRPLLCLLSRLLSCLLPHFMPTTPPATTKVTSRRRCRWAARAQGSGELCWRAGGVWEPAPSGFEDPMRNSRRPPGRGCSRRLQ